MPRFEILVGLDMLSVGLASARDARLKPSSFCGLTLLFRRDAASLLRSRQDIKPATLRCAGADDGPTFGG
jgi:hypothetical protein